MAKIKSYMNPNIPKPKPGDSNGEGIVTKPMEPIKRREITPPKKETKKEKRPPKSPYVRSGERGGPVRPSTPQAEKQPPKRKIGGGGSTKPTPKPLPKPGKPGKPGRPTPKPLPKPGIRNKSGDMGARSRNQRSPRLRGGR